MNAALGLVYPFTGEEDFVSFVIFPYYSLWSVVSRSILFGNLSDRHLSDFSFSILAHPEVRCFELFYQHAANVARGRNLYGVGDL